jgi:NAD(P)-dependent dehydrogenase (short-subunit alcohol dehydrogenase family)
VAGLGIRVNSVHPGHIWTDMMARTAATAPEFIEACRANIPMGEMGQALDIANMNLFLASDEARYVTGAELVVDGGLTAK